MLNMWQPWLTAKDKSSRSEFPLRTEVLFWLPLMSHTHLHVVTLFLVSLISFRRLTLNAFKAWRQYPLLMKKEREREERRNQLRRIVAEILPNFQTWQKSQRWEGDNKTSSVQCYLPAGWNKSRGKGLTKCRGSQRQRELPVVTVVANKA